MMYANSSSSNCLNDINTIFLCACSSLPIANIVLYIYIYIVYIILCARLSVLCILLCRRCLKHVQSLQIELMKIEEMKKVRERWMVRRLVPQQVVEGEREARVRQEGGVEGEGGEGEGEQKELQEQRENHPLHPKVGCDMLHILCV